MNTAIDTSHVPRIVVFTAITSGRDRLQEAQVTTGADFVAFCDRPVDSSTWDERPVANLFHDPARNAKIHKILAHQYFPDHDVSLWLDGSMELADPAPDLVARYLGEHDIVLGRHPSHQRLADEVDYCRRGAPDDPELVVEQVARYPEGMDDVGLPLGGVILRRHG